MGRRARGGLLHLNEGRVARAQRLQDDAGLPARCARKPCGGARRIDRPLSRKDLRRCRKPRGKGRGEGACRRPPRARTSVGRGARRALGGQPRLRTGGAESSRGRTRRLQRRDRKDPRQRLHDAVRGARTGASLPRSLCARLQGRLLRARQEDGGGACCPPRTPVASS